MPCLKHMYPCASMSWAPVRPLSCTECHCNPSGAAQLKKAVAHLLEEVSNDFMKGPESCVALAHLLKPYLLHQAVLHKGDAHEQNV